MANRVLISIEDAYLTFGGKPLFEGLTLHMSEGDKVCLVGKNGAGKTTLMKLMMGELDLDGGKRFVLPNIRMGYLAQRVDHNPNDTVRTFILAGLPKEQRNEENNHKADIVMYPLALDPDSLMGTLSGGQLRRAALARALLEEPDILLLDEPTNHLDLTAIEWLENYLNRYPGAVLCISHDRAFLNAISRKVFWIDRGVMRTCPQSYSEFDDWAEAMLEQEAREIQNMEKKLQAEVDWTQGGVTGRRKRNVRRMRELHKLREKIRQDKAAYAQVTQKIELDALAVSLASKRIAEFKHVGKSFTRDGKQTAILNNFSIQVLRGDRIGILGKNGSGKSTFLKLLIGELEPDSGLIQRAKNMSISYFDQNRSDLDPKKTLWETLCPGGGDHVFIGGDEDKKSVHVCGYLKSFLFDPKMARDRVSTLSGGQQNRLMLAKILSNPGNVLILDEPTNDLDMDTLDMLQGILADYQGTLLIVSHDRDFLDRTVTEVLAFEGDAIVQSHLGGYTDYLEAKLKAAGKAAPKKNNSSPSYGSTVGSSPAAALGPAIKSQDYGKRAAKLSFKLKHELENLPAKIASLEEEIKHYHLILSDPALYMEQPQAFDRATRHLTRAETALAAAEIRWLELEELQKDM